MSVNSEANILSSNIWRREVPKDDLNFISELLRSKKIRPNELLKNSGCSLFHLIVGHKNENFAYNVVRLFLKFGANPNLRSDDGLTPLHVAAIWNKRKILKLLLDNEANALLKDIDGKSTYDYALEENNDEILIELQQYTLTQSTNFINDAVKDGRDFYIDNFSLTADLSDCTDVDSQLTFDQSSCSSMDSYKTAIEEFEYRDDLYDVTLIERRILPVSSSKSSRCSTPFLANKVTMELLSKRLEKLTFDLDFNNKNSTKKIPRKEKIYSLELEKTLSNAKWFKENLLSQKSNEYLVLQEFNNETLNESQRMTRVRWKDQCQKSSFNYLLLDPRITQNLPNKCENMAEEDVWATFLQAIFYVGKGQRSRPYSHLYEAFIKWRKIERNQILRSKFDNKKMERILKIWADNYGVICLHVFQNVLQNEALTREAAMIDAIGLKHLTNLKRGQYYGTIVGWPLKQKKIWGISLLYKALQIFLHEGEKQLRPHDVNCV